MHVTPVLHILHNSSEGIFLCLPEELYILSAFFVSHVHSEKLHRSTPSKVNLMNLSQQSTSMTIKNMYDTIMYTYIPGMTKVLSRQQSYLYSMLWLISALYDMISHAVDLV